MGSITKREGPRGTRYRASIRIKRDGELVHQESETFGSRSRAERWIKDREKLLGTVPTERLGRYTIKDAIDEYVERFEQISDWGRTKRTTLKFLRGTIGDWDAKRLTSEKLVEHIIDRRKGGAEPPTAGNDLIWLRVVFKALRGLKRDVALQAVEDAILTCNAQRLIGRSKRRDRRPTDDELGELREYFTRKSNESTVPMVDIVDFAIASTRRQAEITRLQDSDNDPDTLTGMVRDAKHPTRKRGNHKRFKYTEAGWEIQARQRREGDLIFPFSSKTIGTYFTNACRILEIPDLRFHDLRHEGTSRLFEAGYSIIEVQQFTLHEDWKVLQRYTHLRPEDVALRG